MHINNYLIQSQSIKIELSIIIKVIKSQEYKANINVFIYNIAFRVNPSHLIYVIFDLLVNSLKLVKHRTSVVLIFKLSLL